MEEIARIGRGRYFAATNARDVTRPPRGDAPPGLEVLDASGGLVTRVPLDGEPVELKPGSYRVRLPGSSADPLDLTLSEDQSLALRVDPPARSASRGLDQTL
jgi:hypothetical protein